MTVGNVLIYVALIGYVLFTKARGRAVGTPKQLLVLPVILIVLGYGDATRGSMGSVDVVITVIGSVMSLGLGAMRGFADRLSTRDGAPYVQWGPASFGLFAGNIVAKLVLDLVGVAVGGTAAGAEKSLVLSVGLTLAGEALVLMTRSGGVDPRQLVSGRRERR